jgi:hypothetical protein
MMEQDLVWYKTPEAMAKCRARQKQYYEERKANETILYHCDLCNKTVNDLNKWRHWKSKKHIENSLK